VTRIIAQARSPAGLKFDLLAEDGQRYRLKWAEISDVWSIDTSLESGVYYV
jgi:hypothetical protein